MIKILKNLIFCILIFTLFLTSCTEPTDEEIFYEVLKTFNDLESYSCISTIAVEGNKSQKLYKARHIFKKPNKYIIEIIEPQESKGCLTVYDGNQAWMYHPGINQSFVIRDFEESPEQNMFIGYFLKNLVTTEEITYEIQSVNDTKYLVLTTSIPGNNRYRYQEKLWINIEDFTPYKLVVLDKDGKINTEIKYSEFKDNVNLKDEDFNIKVSRELINKI